DRHPAGAVGQLHDFVFDLARQVGGLVGDQLDVRNRRAGGDFVVVDLGHQVRVPGATGRDGTEQEIQKQFCFFGGGGHPVDGGLGGLALQPRAQERQERFSAVEIYAEHEG